MALSCERHTAVIYDRGGKRKVMALTPLSRVKWGRVRDTISTATAYVAAASAECRNDLGLVEAGRHELVIFRGRRRVWEGPITRITYQGNAVTVDAHDVMHYPNRTIMHNEYDNRYPNNTRVLDRVKRIMTTELARKEALDPPVNVLQHITYAYAGDATIYSGRHYNTIPLVQAIRASASTAAINALLVPMRDTYGLQEFSIRAGNGTGEYGIIWEEAKMGDHQIKEAVVAVVQGLAKYPPEFIRRMNLHAFWFTKKLSQTTTPAGWNIAGLAVDRRLYLDILDDGEGMIEWTFQHELTHLIWNHYAATQVQLTKDWMAANPPSFGGYSGNNYMNPPVTGEHPEGFTRDYGRASVAEDIADVAGMAMNSMAHTLIKGWAETDPYLARKLALYRAWLGQVSGGLVGPSVTYFDAVNTGKSITITGPSGARDAGTAAHTLPHEMTVFEHIDNFAQRGGLDYTVVGRKIIFFDVRTKIGQTPMVTENDFLGEVIITQYGMELATRVEHTDGKGHFGAAGGIDPYYGEWETLYQAYDEDAERDGDEPPSVAELESQAQRTYAQSKYPPLVVRVPDNTTLNPEGVLKIEDLVPGVHIPLTATLPGRTLSQMQKLDSMTVEEDSSTGEQVKVVLSPAPGAHYMDEDEL